MSGVLSVGITTRNRPAALRACLASLTVLGPLHPDILVFDDNCDVPVADQIADSAAEFATAPRVLRDTVQPGYIVGRNRLVAEATGEFVLLLDDDTRMLSASSVEQAIDVMRGDARVAAVAFAQAESDGSPWPARMQPSTAQVPTIVPSFIGFAHLLRRAVFMELGGYRESFEFYGEEKEFCLRLIEAGYQTIYLPHALIAHVIDPETRDRRRYLRFVARNDCLNSLYNDPIGRMAWTLPARYALYFRMRRVWKVRDPWGGWWLARDLVGRVGEIRTLRRPVSKRTLARWGELRAQAVAYDPPAAGRVLPNDGGQAATDANRLLSIGITTRNRPEALRACLASLPALGHLHPDVLVFDDNSDVPAAEQIADCAATGAMVPRVLRDTSQPGTASGRNRLVAQAGGAFVLLLDDDTRILSASSVDRAIAVLRADPRVGAVAFAQAEADGQPWPVQMQPSTAQVPSFVTAYIGFAHMVRRSTFLALSGYRESFQYQGEERDFCLRLLDAGYGTVYLPDALVAHVIDRGSRDSRRYLRLVSRNDCLNTLYNDPFGRVLWMLPARYARYFQMRRGWKIRDPWGGWWLARDLAGRVGEIRKLRRPVSRRTLARWRELRAQAVAYQAPSAGSARQAAAQ